MTEATEADELDGEFNAAWGDDPAAETAVDDEFAPETVDAVDGDAPESPDAASDQDSKDQNGGSEPEPTIAELKKEIQRLRSAEGRYVKFGSDLEAMRTHVKALEAKLAAKEQPAAAADTAQGEDGADEDDEDLDPEFAKAIERRAEKAAKKLMEPAQQKLEKWEREQQEAEQRRKQELEEQQYVQFENAVRSKVPEYDDIMDNRSEELNAFIESQSPAIRRAYQLTIESGTLDEVVDLLSHFKAEKLNPQQRTVERKADAAAAVKSRRAAIPMDKNGQASKDDFDAAWRE